jgi:lipopolysaccharide transport system ATP-binding protein
MKPIIRVENLSKQYRIGTQQASYGTFRDSLTNAITAPFRRFKTSRNSKFETRSTEAIWALKDVSFEIQPSEVVGIIGRNGAGKSTLLKILSRITEPTTGQVDLYGRVGSLLEVGTGFHPELTGRENIYLNGAILGMRREEIAEKFDEIVAFAEIEKFIDTPVKHYSSGMYVRLAFAVAAHLEPEILVVDEVLAVGDIQFQKKCLGKMDEVARGGRTVLFVSHNLSAMQQLCQKGIYIKAGKLEKISNMNSVVDSYQRDLQGTGNIEKLSLDDVKAGDNKYINWYLENSSMQSPHSCLSGETCSFNLTLVCKREVKKAVFGFTLQDLSDQKLLSFHSKDTTFTTNLNLKEGVYRAKWKTRLPLKAGQYQIVAGFADEDSGKLFDMWFGQPLLNVLAEKQSILPENWVGLISEPCDFTLDA